MEKLTAGQLATIDTAIKHARAARDGFIAAAQAEQKSLLFLAQAKAAGHFTAEARAWLKAVARDASKKGPDKELVRAWEDAQRTVTH